MTPNLIVTIRPTSLREARTLLSRAEKAGDTVEVWCDRIHTHPAALSCLLTTKKPLLLTLKDASERGDYRGTLAQRAALLATYAKSRPRLPTLIDLPLAAPASLITCTKSLLPKTAQLILSHHDFLATPTFARLHALARSAQKKQADIIKIAVTAHTPQDALTLLTLAASLHKKHLAYLALAMGEQGSITRILTPYLGAYGTFAPLPGTPLLAPGQLPLKTLKTFLSL